MTCWIHVYEKSVESGGDTCGLKHQQAECPRLFHALEIFPKNVCPHIREMHTSSTRAKILACDMSNTLPVEIALKELL